MIGMDPADLCAWLAPLGYAERLRVIRALLFGDLTPSQQFLREYDRLDRDHRQPPASAILTALRLAPDLHTCRELLAGQPVDPARLDQHELARAKNRKLVRLDMTALDQLGVAA